MYEICIILLHIVGYCYEVRLLLVMEFVLPRTFLLMDCAEHMMVSYIVVQVQRLAELRLVRLGQ